MGFKWESNGVHLLIAIFSMFVSVFCIFIYEQLPPEEKSDQWLVNHVCLLHIFGSIFLFVCALKPNKCFLVPYLISALIFAYTLVHKSLKLWFLMNSKTYEVYSINLSLYSFAGLWIYFIVEVCLDLQKYQIELYNELINNN